MPQHKSIQAYLDLPQSSLASHFREKVHQLKATGRYPELRAFLPQHLWPWLRSYLKYVFHRKHPFTVYPDHGERGCYALRSADGSDRVRIAIAGDWGNGTREAAEVAACMARAKPDYTLHLGDVYYVGDRAEKGMKRRSNTGISSIPSC